MSLSMVVKQTMFLILLHHFLSTSSGANIGQKRHLHKSLLTDTATLLTFKKAIILDPNSMLANWNETSDVCSYTGVACGKYHHRVVRLNLYNCGLAGMLSPSISNLTGLRSLNLTNNHLSGFIPSEFSSLRHLRYLALEGNNLKGPIPDSFANLSNLTTLALMGNKLNGKVPPSIFSNGSLKNLDISNNLFTGRIPEEVGNCRYLWNLNLYNNQFIGQLPFSLVNTTLLNLDVEFNHLSGELPTKIVKYLSAILYLHLSYNNMTSHDGNTNLEPFFTALENCTSLRELELAGMEIGLGGRLSDSMGKWSVDLKFILMQENQISGSIPQSIANLVNITVLNLTFNLLNGTIPRELSQLLRLEQLLLSHNLYTSTIPAEIGQFPHLGLLDLSHNKFYGAIPATICSTSRLYYLFLNNNLLSGTIPPAIGHCTDLCQLDLSFNNLTGAIPSEILGIKEISFSINLSHNHLQGNLPIELSKLEFVLEIDLSSNDLNGSIFSLISGCYAVQRINFSHNVLQGNLPDSLGDLKNLESFDVSRNHLSGMIPVTLNKIHTLTYLNLSFNDFKGVIPSGGIFNLTTNSSFLGNEHLCGKIPGMHFCSRKRNLLRSRIFLVIFIIVIFISVFFSVICCVIAFHRLRIMLASQRTDAIKRPTSPELIHNFPRITYRELSEATGRFDEQRIVGSGSYGRVYRGVLSDGTSIAIKVLPVQSDFKALVLPYMANGSLEGRLYPHSQTGLGSGSSDLSLTQRVNICSDIAEGVAYLHHHSPVRVIHCDLKPSNVLLNDDMTALVSDFGIARLVISTGGAVENMGNSTVNMLCGSIGYIAPGNFLASFFRVWFWVKHIYKGRCLQLWNSSARDGDEKKANR